MVELVGRGDTSPNREAEREGASWGSGEEKRFGSISISKDFQGLQEEGPSLSKEATVSLL